MSSVLTTLASLFLASSAFASTETVPLQIPVHEWQPQVGDQLLIDTEGNWGYLAHDDGLFIRFPVVTGQRRSVRYIGRYYNAATPAWDWEIKSAHRKGDRITFGPTGRFLRLYKNGEERTAYGIHGHKDAAQMLAEGDRFRSMGCIIVSESILDIIEEAYEFNGGSLAVKTLHGDPFAVLLSREENGAKTD